MRWSGRRAEGAARPWTDTGYDRSSRARNSSASALSPPSSILSSTKPSAARQHVRCYGYRLSSSCSCRCSPGHPGLRLRGKRRVLLGIPVDFVLFAMTLIGVAVFHHYTLRVAVTGLAAITVYKLVYTGFKDGPGIGGLLSHLQPRVGHPDQPAVPAGGLRAAVESFREEPRAGGVAAFPAG